MSRLHEYKCHRIKKELTKSGRTMEEEMIQIAKKAGIKL